MLYVRLLVCWAFPRQYLVKWEDYDASESTWEPEENLRRGCAELLREFKAKQAQLASPPAPQQGAAKKTKTGK
jgi:hypothetical protein